MLLRFGPNELDSVCFELRRSNRKVRLAPQPMELLLMLVDRRGQLVARQEIGRHLWPGLDVADLDARINTAVGQIRAALNDDPAKPRYIQTVIGRGYRFTYTVEEVVPATVGTGAQSQTGSSTAEITRSYSQVESVAVEPVAHLTSQALNETGEPASTRPELPIAVQSSKRVTWRMVLTAGCVLAVLGLIAIWRLVPLQEVRTSGDHPITLRQVTSNDSGIPVLAAAISPDGKLLAYTDTDGFFVKELATGHMQVVLAPLLQGAKISWFPDQRRLLLSGFPTSKPAGQIWVVSRSGEQPRLFRDQGENGVVSPDGGSVAFTVNGGTGLWVAGVGSDRRERAIAEAASDEFFSVVFWAADSKRVSYLLRRHFSSTSAQPANTQWESGYQWSYVARDIQTGHVTATRPNTHFESAAEVNHGILYYLETGYWYRDAKLGVWTVHIDPVTGQFIESPRLLGFLKDDVPGEMTVSTDGRVFAGLIEQTQTHVYLGSLRLPGPSLADVQRLTYNSKTDFPHAWDTSGQWVYFESNRNGLFHIYRQHLGTRVPETLTSGDMQQVMPELTNGGQTLVYDQFRDDQHSLYRANIDGSVPLFVRKLGPLDGWECPVNGTVCVLRESVPNDRIVFSELDLANGKGKELAHTAWMPGVVGDWALSRDGMTAALPDHDEHSPSIRLVPLHGGAETQIKVHEAARLWGLHWAADGKGFFAELRAGAAVKLEYVDLSGDTHLLREARYNMWGVPSPDGKQIVFPDYTLDRNVCIWQ